MTFIQFATSINVEDDICINIAHIVSIQNIKGGTVISTVNSTHTIGTEYSDFMYQLMNPKSTIHLTIA